MLNPYMPEEGMPIMDYLRLKFGDEAAERFVSGSSPVSQQGKAAVRNLVFVSSQPCPQLGSQLFSIAHFSQSCITVKLGMRLTEV